MSVEVVLAPYPGRGLIHLTDSDGVPSWIYFITGRSVRSRARTLTRTDEGGLAIAPADDVVAHDELRHYTCARNGIRHLVVGNGDHVDQIVDALDAGESLASLVLDIDPEPDPPIWTPRIALVIGETAQMISVSNDAGQIIRRIHDVPDARSSAAVLTTYSGAAGDPLGNAPYREVTDTRSVVELSESLFHDFLHDHLRVLLVAGPARRGMPSAPVAMSFELPLSGSTK